MEVLLPGGRQIEAHGTAVVGIRGARQQTALLERGHLPAGGRHVDAEDVGEVGEPDGLQLAHAGEHPVARAIGGEARSLMDRLLEAEVARQAEQGAQCPLDELDVLDEVEVLDRLEQLGSRRGSQHTQLPVDWL